MAKTRQCPECHGHGGEVDVVLPEEGTGPWVECYACRGKGTITGNRFFKVLREIGFSKALARERRNDHLAERNKALMF